MLVEALSPAFCKMEDRKVDMDPEALILWGRFRQLLQLEMLKVRCYQFKDGKACSIGKFVSYLVRQKMR